MEHLNPKTMNRAEEPNELFSRIDSLLDILDVTHPEKREDAKGVIFEMCKAYAKSQEGQWISVEDRLPTVLDRVLIWHNTSLNASWGMYMGKNEEWCLVSDGMSIIRNWMDGATNVKVTHWMLLPDPPKTEEEEEEHR